MLEDERVRDRSLAQYHRNWAQLKETETSKLFHSKWFINSCTVNCGNTIRRTGLGRILESNRSDPRATPTPKTRRGIFSRDIYSGGLFLVPGRIVLVSGIGNRTVVLLATSAF